MLCLKDRNVSYTFLPTCTTLNVWCAVGMRPPSSQSHELTSAKVTRKLLAGGHIPKEDERNYGKHGKVKVLKPRNQAQKSKDSSEPASLVRHEGSKIREGP